MFSVFDYFEFFLGSIPSPFTIFCISFYLSVCYLTPTHSINFLLPRNDTNFTCLAPNTSKIQMPAICILDNASWMSQRISYAISQI